MVQQLTKETTAYKLDFESCRKIARIVCYRAGIHWSDKEDFAQDVLVEMMERARRDSGGLTSKEMWRAAGCVRSRYWRIYKKASRASSLNELVPGTTLEYSETIVDDKPLDLDAVLDAKSHLEQLPPGIIALGKKLKRGDPLTANQRLYLSRFRKGEPKVKPNQRIANYDAYHRLRAKGLCVKCGKESGKFSRCPECRGKHALYMRERVDAHRVRENTLTKHWRKQGRCSRCGGIPEPGYKLCPRCQAIGRNYHAERAARKGKCPRCGAIPEPGFKTCLTCRIKNRKWVAACHMKRVAKITRR